VSNAQARLGARVRAWRLQRGWTQETLGERAGLSYKFIGEIERGVGNPTIDSVQQIARAFGADIADLLQREGQEPLYTPLGPDDFAVMREARDTLDSALKRLGARPSTRRAAKRTGLK
jgi:transcriptional regulator with XRE-family HTH domain